MAGKDIRAIIFDFGSVLTMPQQEAQVVRLRQLTGLDEERFRAAYRARRHDYDRGVLDSESYWLDVLRRGGVSAPEIGKFDGEFVKQATELDIRSWTYIREPMVEWARAIKQGGMQTAILSNMPYDHAVYIESTFPWLDLFDVRVFSHEVRAAKPEPFIYETCLRRLGIPGHQAVFIDDVRENVDGARKAGMHTIHFRAPDDLSQVFQIAPMLPPYPDRNV